MDKVELSEPLGPQCNSPDFREKIPEFDALEEEIFAFLEHADQCPLHAAYLQNFDSLLNNAFRDLFPRTFEHRLKTSGSSVSVHSRPGSHREHRHMGTTEVLMLGARKWSKWREETQQMRPRLVDAYLKGADLAEYDLSSAFLDRANLSGADLRNANLRGAVLIEAILVGANLSGADLRNADLRGAKLSKAILTDANLSGADLRRADLKFGTFTGAKLLRADLEDADLSGAILVRANLSGADLLNTNLTDTDLREAMLTGTRRRLEFKPPTDRGGEAGSFKASEESPGDEAPTAARRAG